MKIPYGRHSIDQRDIDAVVEVLTSEYITQGPKVAQFEKSVAEVCRASFGVASNSATSSLHIACRALGVKPGDWVWTSPNSFVASANCARYCGANVDFIDIELNTGNISIEALNEKCLDAKKKGCLPKVVIPVHFAGQSCDMQAIKALGERYGFKIIEDASHAFGAKYQSGMVGSCQYSNIAVFSFHPVKMVTSGEGGVAVTNDPDLAKSMKLYANHGVTRDLEQFTTDVSGGWHYQQLDLGYNYRLSDLHAALGISQLSRLSEFIKKRTERVDRYNEAFSELPIKPLQVINEAISSHHLYVIQVEAKQDESGSFCGQLRERLYTYLRSSGIEVNVHYIPIPEQPYFQHCLHPKNDKIVYSQLLPNVYQYYSTTLTLPLYPDLTNEQQTYVINAVQTFFQ